ncbi:MAG: hypothetical protein KKI08_08470 [Armatimonadetes bacterium]|nr:hypothetical protein [Armatimonadota bacterium]
MHQRFIREMRLQSSPSHPNVMPVVGMNAGWNPPFFVMPLASRSLRDSMQGGIDEATVEERARAGNPPLVMLLFRRPDKVMFVPYNNTDEDLTVTIKWDAAKLGIGPLTELEDIFPGTKVKVQGNQATVKVTKRNFGMWTVR